MSMLSMNARSSASIVALTLTLLEPVRQAPRVEPVLQAAAAGVVELAAHAQSIGS